MNTVDERILIPASPQIVWAYISDLRNNTEWQTNCLNMSFITTSTKGQGTRWRFKTPSGRENVIEVSAWYERIGYEYLIIDGAPFKTNLGRIRLQDTPEGTVVQWTFSYEPNGIFGGIRNAVSLKRSLQNQVVDSLWALWRIVSQMSKESQADYIAKSLMQDAPDVDARAQYKPRHPSIMHEADLPERINIFDEPPIADEDTKPRPSISTAERLAVHTKEPDFLSEVTDAGPISDNIFAPLPEQKPSEIAQEAPNLTAPVYDSPVLMKPVILTPSEESYEPELIDTKSESSSVAVEPPFPVQNLEESEQLKTETTKSDTSEISVFDIFGIPKPSATQQAAAIDPVTLPPPSPETISSSLAGSTRPLPVSPELKIKRIRLGLRLVLRRNLSRTRSPY